MYSGGVSAPVNPEVGEVTEGVLAELPCSILSLNSGKA